MVYGSDRGIGFGPASAHASVGALQEAAQSGPIVVERRLLAAKLESGGFGCDMALNLDGGPSTQISFRVDAKAVELAGWRWKKAP